MYSLHILCVIGILSFRQSHNMKTEQFSDGTEKRCIGIHTVYDGTENRCNALTELKSSVCNGNGKKNADGTCDCDPDFFGKECECSLKYNLTVEACISPGSSLFCSGRGECVCGMCQCFQRRLHSAQRYTGQYCQCDDYSCNYHDMLICGGNGRCDCGECVCNEGFLGNACEYKEGNESCISPESGMVCNGHGECVYGRCQCYKYSVFKGPYCDECPTCPGKCTESKRCALCYAETYGNCTKECGIRSVTMVDTIDDIENTKDDERMCQFNSPNTDRRLYFTYAIDEERNIRLRVLNLKTQKKDGSDDDSSSTSCLIYSAYVLTLLVAATMLC